PDGLRLAAGSPGGRTAVWDLRNPGAPAEQFDSARVLAFSSDGARLATDGGTFVQILDLRTPDTPILELPRPAGFAGSIQALAFSPDGTHLTVGTSRGRVVSWPLWTAAAEQLCIRIWRNFSIKEWRRYVGEGIPYERTCPRLPSGAGIPN